MSHSHTYSGNPLDRGERERRDENWITAMPNDPTSKFLPMNDLNILVRQGSQDTLGWLSAKEMQRFGSYSRVFLLGCWTG